MRYWPDNVVGITSDRHVALFCCFFPLVLQLRMRTCSASEAFATSAPGDCPAPRISKLETVERARIPFSYWQKGGPKENAMDPAQVLTVRTPGGLEEPNFGEWGSHQEARAAGRASSVIDLVTIWVTPL